MSWFAGCYAYGDKQSCYGDLDQIRKTILENRYNDTVWIADDNMVGFIQAYLDPTKLSQKSTNDDIALAYNGQIINLAEIHNKLKRLGKRFDSDDPSDNAIILQAFAEWGVDCVRHFRGVYAIAAWSNQQRKLWLFRDPIGGRPLYYSIHNNQIIFSTKIKALLALPSQKRSINEQALASYLTTRKIISPATFLQDIYSVLPGRCLQIDANGTIEQTAFWDSLQQQETTADEFGEEMATAIIDTIAAYCGEKGPLGIFLSGGLDSSLLAAVAARERGKDVVAYSVGFAGNNPHYFNENEQAAKIAAVLDINHRDIILDAKEIIPAAIELVTATGQPLGSPLETAVYLAWLQIRKDGTEHCMMGQGADSLFDANIGGGKATRINKFALSYPTAAKLWLHILGLIGRENTSTFGYLNRACAGFPAYWGYAELFTDKGKNKVLSARLRQTTDEMITWQWIQPIWENFCKYSQDCSLERWKSYLLLSTMGDNGFAIGNQIASIAGGTVSYPFGDNRLIGKVYQYPSSNLVGDGTKKWIIKKAAKRFLPENLISGPKKGWWTPIQDFYLVENWRLQIWSDLQEFCRCTDIFDEIAIKNLVARGDIVALWYLWGVAIWWKYVVKA